MEDYELDKYTDMTLPQIMKLLGNPNNIGEKNISNGLRTPVEPIYSAYFSEEEMEKGVTITIASWILNKGKTKLLVWLRNRDDELIAFTSWQFPIREGNVKY